MRYFIDKMGFLLIKIGWWLIRRENLKCRYPGMDNSSHITIEKEGFQHIYSYNVKDKDGRSDNNVKKTDRCRRVKRKIIRAWRKL